MLNVEQLSLGNEGGIKAIFLDENIKKIEVQKKGSRSVGREVMGVTWWRG